ncbi:hypothetical protein [Stappia sp. 28M-7]|uniref:hypothetical protein n=1 Tax=Stappia sp. 28M-7 TaxID=2762596 RepID=UPI00163C54FA|nr:hypothetical protein [Stappia sp. 28M-7]MBC2859502.1 hypothetical protein [Stappia sp. 28M-7]
MREEQKIVIERTEKALDRNNARYIACMQHSASYGMLAVRSAFILNGAALFALPPVYISLLREAPQQEPSLLYLPATMFVLGIVFAALCAGGAYINFQIGALSERFEKNTESINIIKYNDNQYYERNEKIYDDYIKEIQPSIAKISRWVTGTAWVSLLFGILSFVLFFIGCYFAGGALFYT